jgi:hypothetical protein
VFGEIKIDHYIDIYDELIEEKMRYEKIKIELEKDLKELNERIGSIRADLLYYEEIELEERIFDFGLNKGVVLDKLFKCGVIDCSKYDKVKELMWMKRYRKVYSD